MGRVSCVSLQPALERGHGLADIHRIMNMTDFIAKLKFNSDGLLPAIIQDHQNGRVLMLAWMNRESLERTIAEGKTVFWSRSRNKFWVKGETSGHFQVVKELAYDCDGDCLLVQVEQTGPACHEGYRSCFFRRISRDGQSEEITETKLADPAQIYGRK